ncbi:MAG: hypothetical protein MZW92_64625 [Comamonadaceae bacterium]|nr:hypothetical protein [Comamonadaceae bacterium]
MFLDPAAYSYGELWTAREFGEMLILLAPFVWLIPGLFGDGKMRPLTVAWTTVIVLLLLPTGYRGAWVGFAIGASVGSSASAAGRCWRGIRRRGNDRGHATHAAGQERGDAGDRSRPRRQPPNQLHLEADPGVRQASGRWRVTVSGTRSSSRRSHADPRADSERNKWMLSDPHSNTLAMQFAAGVRGRWRMRCSSWRA